ncbi:MAG: hypothetical protein HZC55_25020 [Verrucomicrobia bacterium]|jgi:hypothetical protein|nr:hypothetical protein [Verrucomicrobiota bacterium]
MRAILLTLFLAVLAVRAAEPSRPFSQTLTAEQLERLGLKGLSAAQLADLDAAIGAYARGETTVAVRQAVQQVEQQSAEKVQAAEKKAQLAEQKAATAAKSAVVEYQKKQEPGVIARTLEAFKRKQEDDKIERFTARVVGPFRGWSGGTYFPLENGQVWKQVGSESNEMPVVANAEVEIYQSRNGYWRLRYGGAWITVKRLQ